MSSLALTLAGDLGGDDPAVDARVFTQFSDVDLLAVLDNLLPEWYLAPLRDPGPGYEWFQAVASMLARASLAVARTEACLFVRYSHGGSRSEADVELFRDSTMTGAFVVKAGTIVRASRTNRSFEVTADAAFGVSDLAVTARVRAVAPSPEYDVPGPVTTADGTVLPGEIDQVALPVLDPVFAEPALQVRQLNDATGGGAAVLDQLGLDRDLPRFSGEADDQYRRRVAQLPDTVSPDALHRQLDAVFLPLRLSYQVIETWQSEYQTSYDFPASDLVHPELGRAAADCFVFDDPRVSPFRGRMLDESDHMGGLIVVVPDVGSWSQRAMAYDDPGTLGPDSVRAEALTVAFQSSASPAQEPVLTSTSVWAAQFVAASPGDASNGTIRRDGTGAFLDFSGGLGLVATFGPGSPSLVEVRDHQRFDAGTSSWVSAPDAVGVRVRSDIAVATAWIESAVATTSLLLTLATPDPDPRKAVDPAFIAAGATVVVACSGGVASDQTTRGWRATSALDAPDRDGDPAAGLFFRVPFLDGGDLARDQFYLRVSDLVTQIKGGGTDSTIELQGQ